MTDATAGSLRRDVTVVGLVSGGHFMSHYFSTILPPLFPFLHQDLGVSYTFLGLLLSVRSLSSGTMQLPAGILVDRYGSRALLIVGFGVMIASYLLISVATSFWVLALLFLIAGVGNSVFHPADYSIMNGTISESRIGRSFSAHTFCGNLGDALAPVVILTIAAVWSWRAGMVVSCVVATVILATMMSQWNRIQEGDVKTRKAAKANSEAAKSEATEVEDIPAAPAREPGTWDMVMQVVTSRPMLYLFLFFALQSLGRGGFRNWAVAGLVTLHHTPVAIAGSALTGFLFASAFGVLVGGVIADRNSRHDLVAAVALLVTAVIAVVVGSVNLHFATIVFLFTFAGLIQGMIRPARDMMIRTASPKGAIGKAFGFVFSGQAIGGTIAPIVYGFLIDIGVTDWVFYSSGIFMVICMLAVLGSAYESRKQRLAEPA